MKHYKDPFLNTSIMESIREFFSWLNSRLQLFIFGSERAKFGIYVQALFVRVEAEFDTPLRSDALAWVGAGRHQECGQVFSGRMAEWNSDRFLRPEVFGATIDCQQ